MRKHVFLYLTLIVLALSSFGILSSEKWLAKEGSYFIKFSTDKAEGVINGLKGKIDFDKNNIAASSFDVTVDVNTLNTGNGLKNKHAKDASFLDAAHYPAIHFVTSKISKASGGFVANGNLTIKNVTKQIAIPFTFNGTGNTGTFSGNFQINRKDYNLNRDGVGEMIKIEMNIPVTKQ